MNKSLNIFLINDEVKMVAVSYEKTVKKPDKSPAFEGGYYHSGSPEEKTYLFKTFETFEEGDLVIVPTKTRHGYTVVKVVDPDVEPNLDDLTTEYKWIAGKFDPVPYETILRQEAAANEKIQRAEKRAKRAELREKMHLSTIEDLGEMPLVTHQAEKEEPKED